MKGKCFSIGGYSNLYVSLIEFHNISEQDAAELIYLLYEANMSSNSPSMRLDGRDERRFKARLHTCSRRPYRTEVQFYKSMQALHKNIDPTWLDELQRQALEELYSIMGEIEYEFLRAYGMEIDDTRTVYGQCVADLTPQANEPHACLLSDVP